MTSNKIQFKMATGRHFKNNFLAYENGILSSLSLVAKVSAVWVFSGYNYTFAGRGLSIWRLFQSRPMTI